MKTHATTALLALGLLIPTTLWASPWTLPRGRTLVSSRFDVLNATHEFLENRNYQRFPVNGRFMGGTIALSGRLGMTDKLELEAVLPLRLVAYTSDPVVLRPQPADSTQLPLDYYRQNVVDFTQSSAGVADIFLFGRYQWLLRPVALATELMIKAPTGYQGPSGTFGEQPDTLEKYEEQDVALPENVRDDVTLGDGQLDLQLSVLAGTAFSTGTFVRAGVGYKLRFGGAGDQVVADLRMGQSIGRRFLIYASGALAYALQTGRVVGVTVGTTNPELSGAEFDPDLHARPYLRTLDYDSLDVGVGFIWRVLKQMELNFGYQRTVWGRNVAATDVASLSFSLTTELFDGSD